MDAPPGGRLLWKSAGAVIRAWTPRGLAVSMAQGQTAEAELPAHSERARPREEVVRGELRAEEKPG